MSMDLTGALTEKIGPLPGYAYVGLGVVGVFAYRKFRPNKAVVTPSTDAPTTIGISPSATPADVASNTTPDNSAWALAAAQHLATTTPLSGSEISTALANYLAGGGLTTKQQGIVDQAIASQGFPSQGLIPVVAQDVPAPTLPTAQPTPQNMPTTINNYYGTQTSPSMITQPYVDKTKYPDESGIYNPLPAPSVAPTPSYNSVPVKPPSGPVATYPATRIITRGD